MLTQEDLQAIAQIVKVEIEPVNQRLDGIEDRLGKVEEDIEQLKEDVEQIKEDIEQLKEDSEITRDVTNSIGEWIDFYFSDEKPYPLDKDEAV